MYRGFLIFDLLLLCFTGAFAQGKWDLRTEKDGIKVYTRPFENSKIKEVKVECSVQATLSQMVAVLLDIKSSPEWIYHTKSCTLIKQVSPSELYYYSEISLPWPAENRDFVAHLSVSQNQHNKVVTVDGPAVPGFVPHKDGIVRISSSSGKWVISPAGKNEIKIEYTLQVDPGGAIPAWLVNMFAAEGPTQIFTKLKLQIQKPAYKDISLPFIQN